MIFRTWMGKTLLKNKMPSFGPALMWPVLSSPAWREACLPVTIHDRGDPNFEALMYDCSVKGVLLVDD
jgi:hypothetical protein